MCDRIGIMYRGRLVEEGTGEDIYTNPQHIYTKRLIAAIPDIKPEERDKHKALRKEINQEFSEHFDRYLDAEGRIFDLRPVTETHKVALPLES